MTDLHDALQQRADRGRPRGAMAVLDAARGQGRATPQSGPDRHRRVTAVLAVAVVVLLVAVAVLVANRDEPATDGPVDEGQIDTTPSPEVIEGPMFGAETGTTLIVSGGPGPRAVAIDLDGGTVRALDGVTPIGDSNTAWDEIGVVQDQLVFTSGQQLWSASTGLDELPAALPGSPLGRDVGSGDLFAYFPSGDADRYWVTGGPFADRPEREFLAEERDLTGAVVTPPFSLGRSEATLLGATSELVIVSVYEEESSRVELRNRATQEVVRTLPGFLDVEGERIVWTEGCARCVHILDVDTGEEREISFDEPVDLNLGAELSPDGRQMTVAGTSGTRLGAVDLDSGHVWLAASAPGMGLAGGVGLRPQWSPDGQWIFAATGGMGVADSSLIAFRVGDERGTEISIDGLSIWSLLAIPRVPGPPAGDVAPCGPVMAGPCRPIVTAGPPAEPPTPDDEVDTQETVVSATTETTMQPGELDPSAIPVVVANGSGVSGAAGAVTQLLIALGYNPGNPTDTAVPIDETVLDTVYYITGFEDHALQVASDLGLSPEAVLPLPGTVPVRPEDLGLAGVLVVLGSAPGGLADAISPSPSTAAVLP